MNRVNELKEYLDNDLLSEINVNCAHYEPLDNFLFRFYHSCEFDKEFTKQTIQSHILWTKTNEISKLLDIENKISPDTILQCETRQIASKFPFVQHGRDRKGRAVQYFFASKIDAKGIVQATTADNFAKYQIWLREMSIRNVFKDLSSLQPPRLPPYYLAIMDLKGVRLSQANSSFYAIVKLLMDLDDWHYPDRVDKMILVNAPFFFNIVWKAIKRFAYHTVDQKVEICGSNKNDVAKVLLKYIDSDQLPSNYGGTSPILDPNTQDFVSHIEKMFSVTSSDSLKVADTDGIAAVPKMTGEWNNVSVQTRKARFDIVESFCLNERILLRREIRQLKFDIGAMEEKHAKVQEAVKSPRHRTSTASQTRTLEQQISAIKAECESHKASIRFARNYIEQEIERRKTIVDTLKAEMNNLVNANKILNSRLHAKFKEAKVREIIGTTV